MLASHVGPNFRAWKEVAIRQVHLRLCYKKVVCMCVCVCVCACV